MMDQRILPSLYQKVPINLTHSYCSIDAATLDKIRAILSSEFEHEIAWRNKELNDLESKIGEAEQMMQKLLRCKAYSIHTTLFLFTLFDFHSKKKRKEKLPLNLGKMKSMMRNLLLQVHVQNEGVEGQN